ncbi:GNAT family N-acetyltransferase [Saccharothrix obliqua]|uniref:GNAT family N-acetyltransferase n=1 Tax=Saccharothrix obliqua TaxID=2861747 RepID=UPI001C5FC359|nr:GNAT family N-acetyltransferase [Saccharothrix obliqua]MBW4719672.1 GNAT family N-acetyltransferase [Saccharothrix obliqua]
MRWHSTDDVHEFLARAGDFLRSRPVPHTMTLTVVEKARVHGAPGTVFGWLETGGEVHAVLHRRSTRRLNLSRVSADQAGALADHLGDQALAGVTADRDTALAFAEAWKRRTGAEFTHGLWVRLHRLGTLTPPRPAPEGRARVAGDGDLEHVIRWCREFMADVDEPPFDSWAETRYAEKRYTFWENDTPVAMAGWTPVIGGMVRVDPVYTPARFRGRGYAAAVTAEVSRAALAAGADEVVLFTDPHNRTSNALYHRLGYVPVIDFAGYDFAPAR